MNSHVRFLHSQIMVNGLAHPFIFQCVAAGGTWRRSSNAVAQLCDEDRDLIVLRPCCAFDQTASCKIVTKVPLIGLCDITDCVAHQHT
jgi:hypothetical protein